VAENKYEEEEILLSSQFAAAETQQLHVCVVVKIGILNTQILLTVQRTA
jgi:hypothetical protein